MQSVYCTPEIIVCKRMLPRGAIRRHFPADRMTTAKPHSSNFHFLTKHDDTLVMHAAMAERYVFEDANAALVKLRQFAELLAEHCAASTGIAVEERDSFLSLLEKLWNAKVTGPQISQLFHGLRKAGNDAVDAHAADRREALHQLQMARKLAVWFHKTFGRHNNFSPGPFVVPPDPVTVDRELAEELERLRQVEVDALTQAENLQATLENEQRFRGELETHAAHAFEDLEAALQLAAETKQQLEAERQKFPERLLAVQAEFAAAPAQERLETIKVAQQQEAAVDLDEEATRRIIDAQLREAGWEADSQTLRYSKGTRPD